MTPRLPNPANLDDNQKATLARIALQNMEEQLEQIAVYFAHKRDVSAEAIEGLQTYVTKMMISVFSQMGLSPFDIPEVRVKHELPRIPPCGVCGHDSAQANPDCDCPCHDLFAGILGFVE